MIWKRAILVGLVLWMLPGMALAQLQRVEAVGIYGVHEKLRKKVIVRDEAVQRALWEGVSRVALELIGESGQGESAEPANDDEAAVLEAALGDDMLPYTRRFRILEDRGEQPVLFAEEPGVEVEYVVVVEALVDVTRVSKALESAGLIVGSLGAGSGAPIFVELEGIERYANFERLLEKLRGDLGAVRVDSLGFARGRQLISVEGPLGPEELARALEAFEGPDLAFVTVGVEPSARRIRIRRR